MRQAFFSDRENGPMVQEREDIPVSVFNGFVSLYNKYLVALSGDFPEYCQDGSIICGFSYGQFKMALMAVVPDFYLSEYGSIIPIEDGIKFSQYALLDFLEFCYMHLKDYEVLGFHEYFRHQHYEMVSGSKNQFEYVDDVNRIFQRNGLAYKMTKLGVIERILPSELDVLIQKVKHYGCDSQLNELIDEAINRIYKPDPLDRQFALEKLWDAYERMKTYYMDKNKRDSANLLINDASEGSILFESCIQDEFKTLTNIGNEFRIRHHETNKAELVSAKHIDYFFYRMLALLSMMTSYLK